jgi:hypothetical protein
MAPDKAGAAYDGYEFSFDPAHGITSISGVFSGYLVPKAFSGSAHPISSGLATTWCGYR